VSLRRRAREAAEAERRAAAEVAKKAEAWTRQHEAEDARRLEGPLKDDLQAWASRLGVTITRLETTYIPSHRSLAWTDTSDYDFGNDPSSMTATFVCDGIEFSARKGRDSYLVYLVGRDPGNPIESLADLDRELQYLEANRPQRRSRWRRG
jgi:hypothetical protein